jgi:hypothetical protein
VLIVVVKEFTCNDKICTDFDGTNRSKNRSQNAYLVGIFLLSNVILISKFFKFASQPTQKRNVIAPGKKNQNGIQTPNIQDMHRLSILQIVLF